MDRYIEPRVHKTVFTLQFISLTTQVIPSLLAIQVALKYMTKMHDQIIAMEHYKSLYIHGHMEGIQKHIS